MTDEASRVAGILRPVDIRALHTRDGWGEYSFAVFSRLLRLGLVDQNFRWTELAEAVRRHIQEQER